MCVMRMQDVRQIGVPCVPILYAFKKSKTLKYRTGYRQCFDCKDVSLTSCIPCLFSHVISVIFLYLAENTLVGLSYVCLADT